MLCEEILLISVHEAQTEVPQMVHEGPSLFYLLSFFPPIPFNLYQPSKRTSY